MEVLIKNNDTSLFTIVYPNSGKETVILLHGGPGVPDGITFIIEFLKKNFQVITFHQRGTLKSPALSHNYSMDSYIADINCIADHLGVEKFHLFGHSWGGLYAQLYAEKNPEKLLSLFLCSPGSGTGRQWQETILEVARYNKSKCSWLEWIALNIYSALGVMGSNHAYRKFYRQAIRNFGRGFSKTYSESFKISCIRAKAINQTTKNILQAPLLPEIILTDFKLTITFGDKDIYGASKKYVIQRYPSAAILFIPASGHIPWSHNQKAFVQILEDHYSTQ